MRIVHTQVRGCLSSEWTCAERTPQMQGQVSLPIDSRASQQSRSPMPLTLLKLPSIPATLACSRPHDREADVVKSSAPRSLA